MSYILDALQRADAERERGRVPGLKSQLTPAAGRDRRAATALRPWHALAGLAVMLMALGAWWWASDPATRPTENAPVVSQPDTPATAVQAPAAQQLPASTSPQERTATRAEPVQPILAPPRPTPAAPAAPTGAATGSATPPSASTKDAATPASTSPPAAAAPPAATSTAVPSFGELTADARAQLPAVNVSGSTYSQNPALRMLIANGKVVQEGQDIAPGLRLETIGPRSAVLNHKGLRYSIGY